MIRPDKSLFTLKNIHSWLSRGSKIRGPSSFNSIQFNSICLLFQSTKIQFRNKSEASVYQHISAWDQFILSFGIRLGGLFGPYLDDQQH